MSRYPYTSLLLQEQNALAVSGPHFHVLDVQYVKSASSLPIRLTVSELAQANSSTLPSHCLTRHEKMS